MGGELLLAARCTSSALSLEAPLFHNHASLQQAAESCIETRTCRWGQGGWGEGVVISELFTTRAIKERFRSSMTGTEPNLGNLSVEYNSITFSRTYHPDSEILDGGRFRERREALVGIYLCPRS